MSPNVPIIIIYISQQKNLCKILQVLQERDGWIQWNRMVDWNGGMVEWNGMEWY